MTLNVDPAKTAGQASSPPTGRVIAVMEMLGGGPTATSEMHRMIGTGGLDAAGYLLLIGVVITISALCMLTSRFGVYRILNSKA